MTSVLSARNVSAAYCKRVALNGISVDVAPQEIVAVLGPNGAGKTTLLRVVAGELRVAAGEIALDGQDVTNEPQATRALLGVSFLRQRENVFLSLTVRENLAVADLVNRRRQGRGNNGRTDAVLTLFPELRTVWNRRAMLLSGGERQMLAIGMALMNEAPKPLWLLDEPCAGLAPGLVERLLEIIGHGREQFNATIVFVEHHIRAALTIADRVYVLKEGAICLAAQANTLDVTTIEGMFVGDTSVTVRKDASHENRERQFHIDGGS